MSDDQWERPEPAAVYLTIPQAVARARELGVEVTGNEVLLAAVDGAFPGGLRLQQRGDWRLPLEAVDSWVAGRTG